MIFLIYLFAFMVYTGTVCVSYSTDFKSSAWYFPSGMVLALLANVLWLYVAKSAPDKHTIFMRGLVWDCIIVGCYTLIPIYFGVRFNTYTGIGLTMIIIGMFLTKIQ